MEVLGTCGPEFLFVFFSEIECTKIVFNIIAERIKHKSYTHFGPIYSFFFFFFNLMHHICRSFDTTIGIQHKNQE